MQAYLQFPVRTIHEHLPEEGAYPDVPVGVDRSGQDAASGVHGSRVLFPLEFPVQDIDPATFRPNGQIPFRGEGNGGHTVV